MKKQITFASGDHTSGTFIEVNDPTLVGEFSLKKISAVITGNSGSCTVAVYTGTSGSASLTTAEQAASEVFSNAAIGATALPTPELNATGNPVPFLLSAGESVFVKHIGDVNPTTCVVELYL